MHKKRISIFHGQYEYHPVWRLIDEQEIKEF